MHNMDARHLGGECIQGEQASSHRKSLIDINSTQLSRARRSTKATNGEVNRPSTAANTNGARLNRGKTLAPLKDKDKKPKKSREAQGELRDSNRVHRAHCDSAAKKRTRQTRRRRLGACVAVQCDAEVLVLSCTSTNTLTWPNIYKYAYSQTYLCACDRVPYAGSGVSRYLLL